jgi:hypothetical protein
MSFLFIWEQFNPYKNQLKTNQIKSKQNLYFYFYFFIFFIIMTK